MQPSDPIVMILFSKARDTKGTNATNNGFDFMFTDFRCSMLRTDKTMTKTGLEITTSAFQVWGGRQFCSAPAGVVGKL